MNLLIGCRAKAVGYTPSEGTIIDILYFDKQIWNYSKVIMLFPDGEIREYRLSEIQVFEEDLQFLQQVGKSKEKREKFLFSIYSRFELMDIRENG